MPRNCKATRGRDAGAGRATVGPHRQDLAVTHVAKAQPAARSSTGEQKALLLGIVLAHAELVAERRGAAPILLLDEVAAHLDPRRRAALFARLEGRGQVWMTATEPELFDAIGAGASRFHVAGGIDRSRLTGLIHKIASISHCNTRRFSSGVIGSLPTW